MDDVARRSIVLTSAQCRLIEFHKNETTSCLYWPRLIDRVRKFLTEWESDTDPAWLFNALNTAFLIDHVPGGEDWLVMAKLDDDNEKLTGHMIAQYTTYQMKGWVIVVHHLECDEESGEMIERGWKRVQQWAVEKNVRHVLNYARNQAVARLYRQKFKFKDHRILQTFDMLERED